MKNTPVEIGIVVIMGRNASGKSFLAHALASEYIKQGLNVSKFYEDSLLSISAMIYAAVREGANVIIYETLGARSATIKALKKHQKNGCLFKVIRVGAE